MTMTGKTGEGICLPHGFLCNTSVSAFLLALATNVVTSYSGPLQAEDLADSKGPFVLGEDYPDVPADCRTIKHWIEHAPDTDERISFAFEGELTMVEWHTPIAYLVMCNERDVQVLCVTYGLNGMQTGDVVLFGGDCTRASKRKIILDPCTAS